MFEPELLQAVRDRFHHVDRCPYQGERIYFENAGGSLTLKSVVKVNAELSAIPDNLARINPASKAMAAIIDQGKQDMMAFMGATRGLVFVGETGTECLFRLIRAAALGAEKGGNIVSSTFEHPATMSAAKRWAGITGKTHQIIAHNSESGGLTASDYQQVVTHETRVVTINHTNPVTGIVVDVAAISRAVRDIAPQCMVIVDGIQHAPHGDVHTDAYGVDAYVISGYKTFSRHNYGVAWVSQRLSVLAHDKLDGAPEDFWELGTRDAGAYACFSEVVNYLEWLGAHFTEWTDRGERLQAAGRAISAQERYLLNIMMLGAGDQPGLQDMPDVVVLAGHNNPDREGVVSLLVKTVDSMEVVRRLGARGIHVHIRINDHYSGSVLAPLGLDSCVRVSLSHYNSASEVLALLNVMQEIVAP